MWREALADVPHRDADQRSRRTVEGRNRLPNAVVEDDKLAVIFSGSTRAFFVESGENTPLEFPEPVGSDAPGLVWEDATHILGSTWLSKNREATLRCDVVSGACERIQDGPLRSGPILGFP